MELEYKSLINKCSFQKAKIKNKIDRKNLNLNKYYLIN